MCSPTGEGGVPDTPPWSTGNSQEHRQQRFAFLKHVCQYQKLSALSTVIKAGWSVNECFYTNPWAEECQHALNIAVWHSWLDGVRVLLDSGALTEKASADCRPAPVIPDAVINFCNLSLETEHFPKSRRKAGETERNLDVIRCLISSGCDVNRAGDDGLPVLQIAAQCSDVRALRLLLTAGANTNIKKDRASVKGRSPLTKAVDVNNKSAVKLLLQYGADVNIRCMCASQNMRVSRNHSQSLLNRCLQNHHHDIAILLIKAGSDVMRDDQALVERQLVTAVQTESGDDGWETEEEEEVIGQENTTAETIPETPKPAMTSSVTVHATKSPQVAALLQLRDLLRKPLSLKCLCRKFIRQKTGVAVPSLVKGLPATRDIKEYLLCRDL